MPSLSTLYHTEGGRLLINPEITISMSLAHDLVFVLWDYRLVVVLTKPYIGSGDPNLSHICMENTSPTGPSPQDPFSSLDASSGI